MNCRATLLDFISRMPTSRERLEHEGIRKVPQAAVTKSESLMMSNARQKYTLIRVGKIGVAARQQHSPLASYRAIATEQEPGDAMERS